MAFIIKCQKCGFEQISKVYNSAINRKDLELVTDETGKLPPVKEQCERCNMIFYVNHDNTRLRD